MPYIIVNLNTKQWLPGKRKRKSRGITEVDPTRDPNLPPRVFSTIRSAINAFVMWRSGRLRYERVNGNNFGKIKKRITVEDRFTAGWGVYEVEIKVKSTQPVYRPINERTTEDKLF